MKKTHKTSATIKKKNLSMPVYDHQLSSHDHELISTGLGLEFCKLKL